MKATFDLNSHDHKLYLRVEAETEHDRTLLALWHQQSQGKWLRSAGTMWKLDFPGVSAITIGTLFEEPKKKKRKK